jgi:hypothetical protein
MKAINAIRMGGIGAAAWWRVRRRYLHLQRLFLRQLPAGGVGTFSAVNADSFDAQGRHSR